MTKKIRQTGGGKNKFNITGLKLIRAITLKSFDTPAELFLLCKTTASYSSK